MSLIEKISQVKWQIPKSYKSGMRVPAVIYSDDCLMDSAKKDNALEQAVNVAFLPGIVKYSLAMPDIHWGYGFPIGGVAATDPENQGVISPGGVGYDINCGVRLIRTSLELKDIKSKVKDLIILLYNNIPSGLGSKGSINLSYKEEKKLLVNGSKWVVEKGFGVEEDIVLTEENGCMNQADPDAVSSRAYERGRKQVGTLGSGNHFLEVQVIDEIFDEDIASVFGLFKGAISVMIHTGSRGFGYQVCDDYLKLMGKAVKKYGINLPDRQLACAPVNSQEGQSYIRAMKCAANYAWANRQCLMHLTREVFEKFFKNSWQNMNMHLVYDVAHNIAKFEMHKIDGKDKKLCVHRKGATRALPAGHVNLPLKYKTTGQPVIIPGDMGRCSYLLAGLPQAEDTFYSSCHGAGRIMSRSAAVKKLKDISVSDELEKKGIYVMADKKSTLAEEAPQAYKNVDNVVDVIERASICRKICKMKPLAVIKG